MQKMADEKKYVRYFASPFPVLKQDDTAGGVCVKDQSPIGPPIPGCHPNVMAFLPPNSRLVCDTV